MSTSWSHLVRPYTDRGLGPVSRYRRLWREFAKGTNSQNGLTTKQLHTAHVIGITMSLACSIVQKVKKPLNHSLDSYLG